MHDLLIRNAHLLDGLGGPPVDADLAVRDGKIAEIGRISAPARETIDAGGRTLAPGIIDVHTHYDAQLTWESRCSPSPALGVTTVVIGNCGFCITPNRPAVRDMLIRNLSEVEGMSLEALEAGIDWKFESFGEYMDHLERRGAVPNVAAFFGHSSLRCVVMGEDASARPATADELDRMAGMLRDGLSAGAIGFASSTFENHKGYGGVPMPSRRAEEAEFERLIDVLGAHGSGLFMVTAGERTTVDTLVGYAKRSGRPMVYAALLHNEQVPEYTHAILEECRAARTAGLRIYGQVSCQPLSMTFTLDGAYPFYGVHPWGDLPIDDTAALCDAFADSGFRTAVRNSLATPAGSRLFNGDWSRVEIAASPAHPELEGRTIAALAEDRGTDPLDLFLDLALSEQLATVYNAKLLNVVDDDVAEMLRHPDSLISLSDAGAHLTFFCDAGYGLHLLGRWVRERNCFTLGEAIRELTSRPAEVYGIRDRGRLAPGAWADMILFDPETVGIGGAERVADLPAGQSRYIRRPVGMHGVWVNGVLVHDGTDYCGLDRLPGQILRDFAA